MPSQRAVMIVTQEIDPHADVMVLHLENRGVRPLRFHPQSLAKTHRLTCRFGTGTGTGWTLEGPHGVVQDRDVGSVWYRRPLYERDPHMSPEEAAFAEAETRETVMGAFRLTDALWVNHPDAIRLAESKPFQLDIARDLGFEAQPGYADKCHLCYESRRFLYQTGRFAEWLGPGFCYGLDSGK